jgi:hypothetical protein
MDTTKLVEGNAVEYSTTFDRLSINMNLAQFIAV